MLMLSRNALIKCSRRVSPLIWIQSVRKCLKSTVSYSGYYIVFPDIPKDTPSTNELLRLPINESLTKYSQLTPEMCFKAIGKLSVQFESNLNDIEQMLNDKSLTNLKDVIEAIEKHLVPLDYALSTVKMLMNVQSEKFGYKEMSDIIIRAYNVRSRRFINPEIYYYFREVNSDREKLSDFERRIIDKYLLEAKLSGIDLPTRESDGLNHVITKLEAEKSQFRRKVNEATKRFRHTIDDPNLLSVFPDELISAIGTHSHGTVTLNTPVYNLFMEHCPDPMLRWNIWNAYNTRCSHSVDIRLSNSVHIEEIRSLRKKHAKLLGFDNYVDLAMKTKMADDVKNVKAMINTLNNSNKTSFENCFNELTDFAMKSDNKVKNLNLWDLSYWKRKFIISKYSMDDNAIRRYFPLSAVLNGIFQFAENLFGIRIEEVESNCFDAWNNDVKLYRILSSKGIVGSFYFDPYSRINEKMPGIWIDLPLTRCDSLQTKPLTYFIMNLQRPLVKNHPVLLSFPEVLVMFNKFGHILQHSLSEVPYSEISGLTNIEWDSVNICPEFFQLWPLNCYKVLASCSNHESNNNKISENEFNTIRKAHYHFSSFNLKFELYKMALDIALHSNDEYWGNITNHVWSEYMSPFVKEKDDVHPCSFREIFCDEFPASYYSFKWAEMLAADAFGAFQDVGLDDEKAVLNVGNRFKETFLWFGGGCRSSETFRRFRGRDPSPDAYLEINAIHMNKKSVDKDKEIEMKKVQL